MDFILAKESPIFIRMFRLYTRILFKRRFTAVWLKQDYDPGNKSKTIYYLNHHSWWDGLIPFLLNEYRFRQRARAMMEDKQMRKYKLFQKIGAFSVNLENKQSIVTSLRYAVSSLGRSNSSLFIYPQGTITPQGNRLQFEGGLSWISRQLPKVDVVPIGIYMHTIRHDKPELHLHVGRAVAVSCSSSKEKLTKEFERKLEGMLQGLRKTAGFDDSGFERFV